MEVHRDVRIDLEDRVPRALCLRTPDVGLAVDDLALQIGLVDDVEFDDADGADTRRGQIQQRGRAESAGADHEHLRVLQALLTVHPDVRDDQVAAVAGHLFIAQFGCRLHEGWQRPGERPLRRHERLQYSASTRTLGTTTVVAGSFPWVSDWETARGWDDRRTRDWPSCPDRGP